MGKNKNSKTLPAPYGIIGNGSWATALAKVLTDNGNYVHWWMRKESATKHLRERHHNPNYLSSVVFPHDSINPTTNLQEVIHNSEKILLVTPSAYMEPILEALPKNIFNGKIIISAVKGLLPQHSNLINDYLKENFDFDTQNYFAITGPSHAEEVAEERLSYLTFSGLNVEHSKEIAEGFTNYYLKTTVNNDLWGSQYAAVLKNIYALGAGIAHGADFGDNFLSVYITNCFREMHYFLTNQFDQLHPSDDYPDFHTSAYLGDLLVTSYSLHSRNRTLGTFIGKGYSVKSAFTEMNMVAEGYFAAKSINNIINNMGLQMPIIQTIYRVLWENKSADEGLKDIVDCMQ